MFIAQTNPKRCLRLPSGEWHGAIGGGLNESRGLSVREPLAVCIAIHCSLTATNGFSESKLRPFWVGKKLSQTGWIS